jgi:hypothetical protein
MTKKSVARDVTLMANGHPVSVGMVAEEFDIGSSKRSKQVVPIYDNRIHRYIAEKCKERVKNGFHNFILISGPRRTGKTTNACEIARILNPGLPVDNVAFRLEDFRNLLGTMPPTDVSKDYYSVAVLDEGGFALYNKDWQQRAIKEMGKVMQVIGKKLQTVIICLPHRNLLVGDIREAMDFWICTSVLDGQRGFAELREGCYNKWKLNLYWKPLCGFLFDELDDDWWHEYEMKKDTFIDEYVNEGTVLPDSSRIAQVTEQRNRLIKLVASDPRHSQKEIAVLTGMRKENVCRVVNDRPHY